jgi:multicomponent Na+:H+ antiporter subunit D
VSALFAGLLTKVGLYAIFRVNLLTFPASDYILYLVATTACLSILIGVGGAIIQTNIRRILGFHIVSQVGYIALAGVFIISSDESVRVVGIAAAAFYMIHHIIVKANLYLVSGLVLSATGTENLARISGLISTRPLLAILFAVPALSLAGIPPMSGFWAKLALFKAAIASDYLYAVLVMAAGGFFTVYSMAKIWIAAFWGESNGEESCSGQVPALSILACLVLSLLTLTIGFNPDILYAQVEMAARFIVEGGIDATP